MEAPTAKSSGPSPAGRPPPGPRGNRAANLRERLLDFPAFLERLHAEHGDIVSYQLPKMECCAVFDADLIREMLVDKRSSFPKGEIFEVSSKFIGHPGVFTSEGDDHRRRRKLVEQAFAPERVAAYAGIMVENARALRGRWSAGQVIDVNEETYRLARRVAFGVFFGPERQDDQEIGDQAVRGLKWDIGLGFLPLAAQLRKLPLPGNRLAERACAALDEIVFEAIRRARSDRAGANGSLTSLLVHARDEEGSDAPFTDEEIRSEIYILLLANFDPMAASLAWAIDYISRNPDVREKLEREADDVLGSRPIRTDDYQNLRYTRAVFNEAGRLTPPNYFFDRVAAEDTVLGDFLIRKGTIVQPCFSVSHRQEKHWPQADEFRPERWMDDSSGCPAHAFLLFSHGPRECLGREYATMQGVYVLASIAQSWRLEAVPDQPPKADGKLVYIVKGKFPVVVRERSRPQES